MAMADVGGPRPWPLSFLLALDGHGAKRRALLASIVALFAVGCAKKSGARKDPLASNPHSSAADVKDNKVADSKRERESERKPNPWDAVKVVPQSEQQESTDLHTLSAFKDNGENKKSPGQNPQNPAGALPGAAAAPVVRSEEAMSPDEKRIDKGDGIIVNKEGQPISHLVVTK